MNRVAALAATVAPAALVALVALGVLAAASRAPATLAPAHTVPGAGAARPASRAAREAAFLRTVDRANTANVVTGDLVRFAGTHVAYACAIDRIVLPGLALADCGSPQEPMDLFVHLPTRGMRAGRHVRILGVIEPPAAWTDLTGHTVYYAFMRAIFVDSRP